MESDAAAVESSRSQPDARRGPVLEMLLDEGEKLARHHPVDDAMVEAQAHVHHVPHRDAVSDDDWATDDRLSGEDRRLRLIDDRLAGDRPRGARVVERER